MSIDINVEEGIRILKDKIRYVRNASNGEYIFKCPFCGDNDNPYHGHLYVNNVSGIFNCYRCEMSGNLNKILYLFEGNKFKVKYDHKESKKVHERNFEKLVSDKTCFEKYLSEIQSKILYNDYFDIVKSIEHFPMYLAKQDYLFKRIIKDKSILPVLHATNMTQHLISYYSEHFATKILDVGGIPNSAIPFVRSRILDVKTSILFLGYHNTLSIFKTFDEKIKYFKTKKNVFYGDEIGWDFFTIINQNKYVNSLMDIYKERELNVYFTEGVFDALNLYLHNPKYITGVEPDLIIATGSKVSYASALYFVLDNFMKPVTSHLFLDPDIGYREFFKKYRVLKRVFKRAIAYQNGKFDYGDIREDGLSNIKICNTLE